MIGFGVFARIDFKRGDYLLEYKGKGTLITFIFIKFIAAL